ADAHHIRAEDGPENSLRSNKDYGLDDYNGPAGNQGSWHGDVARSLFYMAVRYNALSLANGNLPDATLYQMGDLATLLNWNQTDPSDDFEMHRNNVVYTWQVNRNPFIDYPTLADYIFGSNTGLPWFAPLSTPDFSGLNVAVYPNPAKDRITISGISGEGQINIYSVSGASIYHADLTGETSINLSLASGIYLARISSDDKSVMKKIIIQ
ncbi:MAG TPA: endonuclease, partial [Flavobacterium sp.]|nr:endonuclease [Flavobacterium sp.]